MRRGVQFVLSGEENVAVDDGVWRRRDARLYSLLCDKAAGLCRASPSDHKDPLNDREDIKDTSWELE